MTDQKPDSKSSKEQLKAAKAQRLAEELRNNLRKRKNLQRNRGEAAPDAIKNRDRLTD
ncbi:hypothetical protein [Sneathiella sp. HT1-7]|jgi:hypothetical protein|uniref:hypothetical protein n=1 Tax=Sneathiella sp. HT1-7 TaxID=2887192 RepID=UPI001D141ACF|nr:hypothetical protein [Sneathiella sp. HT1-7]MCC3304360.1 hypothetical protein [Sneathiella sp. HT1-7]